MIPASYLFKQAYDQAWTEPETPYVTETAEKPQRGLTSPVIAILAALWSRRPQPRHHMFGSHAYD